MSDVEIRAAIRDAFEQAAEIVRKKRQSRNAYFGYSDDEATRERNEAVTEAVEETLTEVADALEAVSESFSDKL